MLNLFSVYQQTEKIQIFKIKRRKSNKKVLNIIQEDQNEYSKIEEFIWDSIGNKGKFRRGDFITNIYLRNRLETRHLFYFTPTTAKLKFDSCSKEIAKNFGMQMKLNKMLRLLKNIFLNQNRYS